MNARRPGGGAPRSPPRPGRAETRRRRISARPEPPVALAPTAAAQPRRNERATPPLPAARVQQLRRPGRLELREDPLARARSRGAASAKAAWAWRHFSRAAGLCRRFRGRRRAIPAPCRRATQHALLRRRRSRLSRDARRCRPVAPALDPACSLEPRNAATRWRQVSQ